MTEVIKKINEFMKVSEAAEFIGVSKNTLRRWEKQKRIIGYKHPINNTTIYKKEDLQDLLRKIQPT